ncbi:MAG TPA: hypothetical protein VM261_36060 [Kofleriaceae bacterium]|nr:hypothetical protein [Kofleriaceae bacterium]
MARIARLTLPGRLYHVISRFVDRTWFLTSDVERDRYLNLLGRALGKTDWRCLAYGLMSNHLHHAMVAGELDLDSWARRVNSPFGRWLNVRHDRLGPVFAERPATYLVPLHREAELIAYIHNNPVRAGVVANAASSSWSSHRAYVGMARTPRWLGVSEGLERAGCVAAPQRFDSLVNELVGASWELPDVDEARADIHRVGPFEAGTPTLSSPIEIPIVMRRLATRRATVPELLAAVAARAGVSMDEMGRRHGRGAVAAAKRIAVHAGARLGITITDVSAALNISRQRGAVIAQGSVSREEEKLVRDIIATLVGVVPQS